MMNIGIIEDEPIAAEHLKSLIMAIIPTADVTFIGGSITKVIDYFSQENCIDVIFSDIELLDGSVFTAFDSIALDVPVIFTTAYDEFMAQAFDTNGIGYILKPYDKYEIEKVLNKYHTVTKPDSRIQTTVLKQLEQLVGQQHKQQFKSRFVVKRAKNTILLHCDNIACIRLELSGIIAYDLTGNPFPLNEANLTMVEQALNPDVFFRANRNDILSINAIDSFVALGKDRVSIAVTGINKAIVCSVARTPAFRLWLEKN